MLNAEEIKKQVGRPVEIKIYELTDSTNARAKEYAIEHCDSAPVLFIAREQSAGRGRMGRSFLSRADSGIFMSLLYFTERSIADAISVTTAAAVTVAEGIERATDKKMKIKWVNDVYNDKGKVCGILTEAVQVNGKNALVVGIGINTGDIDFPEELQNIAASVGDIDGRENRLIGDIVNGLLRQAEDPSDRSYMVGYRDRFMLRGERVTVYVGGERTGQGTVLDVDDDGGLVYLRDGEIEPEVLRSGEVTVRAE